MADLWRVRLANKAVARELARRLRKSGGNKVVGPCAVRRGQERTWAVSVLGPNVLGMIDFNDLQARGLRGVIHGHLSDGENFKDGLAQLDAIERAHVSRHGRVEARSAPDAGDRSDRLLAWAEPWVPRKNREVIFGDLKVDVADFRKAGLSEGQILRRVAWQIGWAVLQRPIVWKSAAAAWLLRRLSAILGSG